MTILEALIPITETILNHVERLHNTTTLLAIFEKRLIARGYSLADVPYERVNYVGSSVIAFSTSSHEETAPLLTILGGRWEKEPFVSGTTPFVSYHQGRPEDDDAAADYDVLSYHISQTGLSPGCTLVEEDVPPDEVKPAKRYRVVCGDSEKKDEAGV